MLTGRRARVLGAAARPLGRAIPWAAVAGVVAVGWLPLAVTLARGGTELLAAVAFAAVVGSGVVAFAVDDDAIELTAASPVPLAQRCGLRLAEVGAAAVAVGSLAVAAAVQRDPSVGAELPDRLAEAAAAAAIALAWGSVAARRRLPSAGLGGSVAGTVSVALVAALAQRVPWLPSIAGDRHHDRWWWLAAVGVGVAAWSWRDPVRRRPVRSRG